MKNSLDLTKAMCVWDAMSHEHEVISWDTDSAYYTLFRKGREVVGHLKAQPGGMTWDYPQELVDNHMLYSYSREHGAWIKH